MERICSTHQLRGCRAWPLLLLLASAACHKTAQGIEQDTLSARSSAEQKAEETRRALERQIADFKTRTSAQLDQLDQHVDGWKGDAKGSLEQSKQQLSQQIKDARSKLDTVSVKTQADWEKAKRDWEARLAELGRQVHDGLDKAGAKIEKTLQ